MSIIGNRYGKLTVLAEKIKKGKRYFTKCLCECGTIKDIDSYKLKNGITTSCGCKISKTFDILGKSFGNLTVNSLYLTGRSYRPKQMASCICLCGNTKDIACFSLVSGNVISCGCLATIKLPIGQANKKQVIREYHYAAKNRQIEISLTDNEIIKLVSQNCYYCDSNPNRIVNKSGCNGQFICNGIDRLSPDIGYIISNCVPCCKICNFMKGNMNSSDFILQCSKIALRKSV